MKKIIIILGATLVFAGCTQTDEINNTPQKSNTDEADETQRDISELETIVQAVSLQNDFNGAKIEEKNLLQGCGAGQDCIPSIDKPEFSSIEMANTWLTADDIVFGINYKGEKRAYPQRILNWHEIVNDEIKGDPIVITFCPLCGSALAFKRVVNNVITEFGVSGKLHNSDLVMYDRYEGNLWQQISGEAIVGPAARRDEVLNQVPIATTTWEAWKTQHPDTIVLSTNTGTSRDYDYYPYGTYEQDDELLFSVGNLDNSVQIKTPVQGIEITDDSGTVHSKAYTQEALEREGTIEDEVGGISITLELLDSGEVLVTKKETGEQIIPIRLFWFAWAAFHPDTELYK